MCCYCRISVCNIEEAVNKPKAIKFFKNDGLKNSDTNLTTNIPVYVVQHIDVPPNNIEKPTNFFNKAFNFINPPEKKCNKYFFSNATIDDDDYSTTYHLSDEAGNIEDYPEAKINFGNETNKQFTFYVDTTTGGKRTRKRRSRRPKSKKSRRPRKSRKSRR